MSTFLCSLCKQDCPYVQGNVFTASDRKFCANCYRILAEKQQKQRQVAAAQAAETTAPPPQQTPEPAAVSPRGPPASWGQSTNNQPASTPPAGFAQRNRTTTATAPQNEPGSRATTSFNRPGGRAAPPAGWGAPKEPTPVSQPEEQISPRSPPTQAPAPAVRQTPQQVAPTPATPAVAPTDPEEEEPEVDGKKKRLFDMIKPQEVVIFGRSHEAKAKEQQGAKVEKKPYTGGPWICEGCNTRQAATAKVCNLCGGAAPVIQVAKVETKKAKEIDPDDPFGHINLLSWDECEPALKKW